jgi:putative flippase GtrA
MAGTALPFIAIGLISTAAYAVLFAIFASHGPAFWANAAALLVTTSFNFLANRRLTFRTRGREQLARQAVQYAAVYVIAATASGIVLQSALTILRRPPRQEQLAAALAAGMVATAIRFILMRSWAFRAAGPRPDRAS